MFYMGITHKSITHAKIQGKVFLSVEILQVSLRFISVT